MGDSVSKTKTNEKNDKAVDLRSLQSRQSYNPTQTAVTVPRVTLLSHPGKEWRIKIKSIVPEGKDSLSPLGHWKRKELWSAYLAERKKNGLSDEALCKHDVSLAMWPEMGIEMRD